MKTIASMGLLILTAAGASLHAAAPSDVAAEFRKLDRNGDGKLSRAEAKAKVELEVRFESLDANHDGSLSLEEYAPFALGKDGAPIAPETAPSGSGNAQHMPKT